MISNVEHHLWTNNDFVGAPYQFQNIRQIVNDFTFKINYCPIRASEREWTNSCMLELDEIVFKIIQFQPLWYIKSNTRV